MTAALRHGALRGASWGHGPGLCPAGNGGSGGSTSTGDDQRQGAWPEQRARTELFMNWRICADGWYKAIMDADRYIEGYFTTHKFKTTSKLFHTHPHNFHTCRARCGRAPGTCGSHIEVCARRPPHTAGSRHHSTGVCTRDARRPASRYSAVRRSALYGRGPPFASCHTCRCGVIDQHHKSHMVVWEEEKVK